MKSAAYEEVEANLHMTPYQIAENALKRLPMTVACTIQPNEVKAFRRSCYRHRSRVENKPTNISASKRPSLALPCSEDTPNKKSKPISPEVQLSNSTFSIENPSSS